MKMVLLGATGPVGRHVLEQALEAGHTVAAVVRDASKLSARSRLEVHQGSLGEAAVLDLAMTGASAVVSALGVTPASKHDMPSRHLPAVLEAMKQMGVRRYIGISGAGIDGRRQASSGAAPLGAGAAHLPRGVRGQAARARGVALDAGHRLDAGTRLAADRRPAHGRRSGQPRAIAGGEDPPGRHRRVSAVATHG